MSAPENTAPQQFYPIVLQRSNNFWLRQYTSNKNARVQRIQTNSVRTVHKSCALGRNPVAQGVPTIAANLGTEGAAQLVQMCRFERMLRVCSIHSSILSYIDTSHATEAAASAYSSLAGLCDPLLHSNTSYSRCHELLTEKRNHATEVAAFTRLSVLHHQIANVNSHALHSKGSMESNECRVLSREQLCPRLESRSTPRSQPKLRHSYCTCLHRNRSCGSSPYVIVLHPNASEDAYAIEFGENIQQTKTQECEGFNRMHIQLLRQTMLPHAKQTDVAQRHNAERASFQLCNNTI